MVMRISRRTGFITLVLAAVKEVLKRIKVEQEAGDEQSRIKLTMSLRKLVKESAQK